MRRILALVLLAYAGILFAAREFVPGTDVAVFNTGTFSLAATRSFFAWCYFDAIPASNGSTIFWLRHEASSRVTVMVVNTTGDLIQVNHARNTPTGVWRNTVSPPTGQWVAIGMTYDGSSTSNDPIIYVDGVDQGALTEATTPVGTLDTSGFSLRIGNEPSSGWDMDGAIMHAAIYERILTPGEMGMLAKGLNPARLRPKFYAQLVGRHSPELDWFTGATGTLTGTTFRDGEPRVFR